MDKQVRRFVSMGLWVVAASLSSNALAQQKHPIAFCAEGVKGRYVQQLIVDAGIAAVDGARTESHIASEIP